MKKAIYVALVALFAFQVNAQEPKQQKKAKTEKSCSAADKKGGCCSDNKTKDSKASCGESKSEKKSSCCSSKK